MKTFLIASTVLALSLGSAHAQTKDVTVKPRVDTPLQSGVTNPANDGLTIRDCMTILSGLNALDAGRNGDGKTFRFSAAVRDSMSHDLFVLSAVQQEAQTANRRTQEEIRAGAEKLNERQLAELDERLNIYLDRPCRAELDRIRKNDLDLERNDVTASTLAAIWKILDR